MFMQFSPSSLVPVNKLLVLLVVLLSKILRKLTCPRTQKEDMGVKSIESDTRNLDKEAL